MPNWFCGICPRGRVGGADQAEHLGNGPKRDVRAAMGLGHADAAQATAGELFDFCPGQLALLVAAGGLLTGTFGQFAGGLQGFGVVAQDLGRQQQGRAVEVAVELGIWLGGHQNRTSQCGCVASADGDRHLLVRWSGLYTLMAY
jgi:hypothetical protein